MSRKTGNVLRDILSSCHRPESSQPSCCVRSLLMQTQPLTLKFQTVGFSLWLNGTLMEIRGPFVESPEGFRANFGWQFSLYLQNKGVSKHETFSYFNFYSLYNVKRPAIQNKQVRVYTNGFSNPKSFWDFRETRYGLHTIAWFLDVRGPNSFKEVRIRRKLQVVCNLWKQRMAKSTSDERERMLFSSGMVQTI